MAIRKKESFPNGFDGSADPLDDVLPIRKFLRIIEGFIAKETSSHDLPWVDLTDCNAVQVERGIVLAWAMRDDRLQQCLATIEPWLLTAESGHLPHLKVLDQNSHARPVYRPLLLNCLTQAFGLMQKQLAGETVQRWKEAIGAWAADLEARARRVGDDGGFISAARGGEVAEQAWIALALRTTSRIAGYQGTSPVPCESFDSIVRSQQPSGAFLRASGSDNPETTWYHELLILHAVANAATHANDPILLAAARRNALFHLAETQPDHATNQPWALWGFLLDPETHSLAESLLHTTSAHLTGVNASPLALMLLADALYCAHEHLAANSADG